MPNTLHFSYDAKRPTPRARYFLLKVKFGAGRGEVCDRLPVRGRHVGMDMEIDWEVLAKRLAAYARAGAVAARAEIWNARQVRAEDLEQLRQRLAAALSMGLRITLAVPEAAAPRAAQERLL